MSPLNFFLSPTSVFTKENQMIFFTNEERRLDYESSF